MNLHFITSISKEYWYSTAKHCINTWNLPGKVTIFIDQKHGDLDWLSEVPYHKQLLSVPELTVDNFTNTAKVRKFWGKTCSQIVSVRNREENERIIWVDSDVEQLQSISPELFNFSFEAPIGIMRSGTIDDCWETGLVIFNQENGKLNQFMKKYEKNWNDEETLSSLWKPYDALVLGYTAEDRGYYNLCTSPCANVEALEHTRYAGYLKHWINKDNKQQLQNKSNDNSSNLS
jgi:hypothetical protein